MSAWQENPVVLWQIDPTGLGPIWQTSKLQDAGLFPNYSQSE